MSLKDEVLYELSRDHNVAQFVSFSPDVPTLRFSAMRSPAPMDAGLPFAEAIARLHSSTASASVNVRSFKAGRLSGNPFHYGITDVSDACKLVAQLASEGFYTIVNETIDVHDGGVSGVSEGGIVEFAPGDTPRAVEGQDHVTLPADLAFRILSSVYGFDVDLQMRAGHRVEFSAHPLRVGVRGEHVVIWEAAPSDAKDLDPEVTWPNPFSRVIGDKAFGLLIAHHLGFRVPRTRVISRTVAPFEFGQATGTGETWLRTAPASRTPGKFTTVRGWRDPFAILASEDPQHRLIASVLAQDGIDAQYSGAAVSHSGNQLPTIEGVQGFGDDFMLGMRPPEDLPPHVVAEVNTALTAVGRRVGPASLEWAYDGRYVWLLQLHRSYEEIRDGIVVPGEPKDGWLIFEAGHDLDELRALVEEARQRDKGVLLKGRVGLTSHVGDVLRLGEVPARLSA